MVERLRYHKFVASLPFDEQTGTQGVEAFLFAEQGASGAPTGRKTLVVWSLKPAQLNLNLQLDKVGQTVSNAQVYDLYGNASAPRLTGQTAGFVVGDEPVYLTWNSPGGAEAVEVVQPLLTVQNQQPLLAGQTTPLTLLARNPTDKPLRATLKIEVSSRLPLQVAPATRTIELAPGATQTVEIDATLGRADAPLALPRWWKVFLDPDLDKLSAADYARVPDALPGAKAGQYVWAPDNRLDFAALGAGTREKRPAIAYATLDAPAAMTLPVAASADYWMAWYLNGQKVLDTLRTGNAGDSLAAHLFELPLKKGRNVLAVVVLSGSAGWDIEFGGPRERALALTNSAPDKLSVSLQADGKVLAEQEVPLQLRAPIASIATASEGYDDWQALEPTALLGEDEVTNFWVKEPDQSRWYRGEADLSAQVWLRESGDKLHLFVAATDDKSVAAKSAADLSKSDSLRLVLSADNGATLIDKTFGLVGDKAASMGRGAATATIKRVGVRTLYHVVMDKSVVGAGPFRVGLTLGDNDDGYLKQSLRLEGVRLAVE